MDTQQQIEQEIRLKHEDARAGRIEAFFSVDVQRMEDGRPALAVTCVLDTARLSESQHEALKQHLWGIADVLREIYQAASAPPAAHRTWVAYWIQYRTDPAVSGAGEGAPWYDDPYWRRAFDTLADAQAALRRTRATGRLSPSCQYRILRREEWEAVEPNEPVAPS